MDTKCAHPTCGCTEANVQAAGQRFCSATCAGQDQKDLADAMCSCAHADCRPAA